MIQTASTLRGLPLQRPEGAPHVRQPAGTSGAGRCKPAGHGPVSGVWATFHPTFIHFPSRLFEYTFSRYIDCLGLYRVKKCLLISGVKIAHTPLTGQRGITSPWDNRRKRFVLRPLLGLRSTWRLWCSVSCRVSHNEAGLRKLGDGRS